MMKLNIEHLEGNSAFCFKIQLNLKFYLKKMQRLFPNNTKFVSPIIRRNVPRIVQFKSNLMVSLLITDIKP